MMNVRSIIVAVAALNAMPAFGVKRLIEHLRPQYKEQVERDGGYSRVNAHTAATRFFLDGHEGDMSSLRLIKSRIDGLFEYEKQRCPEADVHVLQQRDLYGIIKAVCAENGIMEITIPDGEDAVDMDVDESYLGKRKREDDDAADLDLMQAGAARARVTEPSEELFSLSKFMSEEENQDVATYKGYIVDQVKSGLEVFFATFGESIAPDKVKEIQEKFIEKHFEKSDKKLEFVPELVIDQAFSDLVKELGISFEVKDIPSVEYCSICRSDINPHKAFRRMPCSHVFHVPCLVRCVISKQGKCPMCRVDLNLNLFNAVAEGSIDMIKEFISNGFNVNEQDPDGNSLLAKACICDHSELVKFLIDAGADLNIANNKGQTVLMHACSNRNSEMAKLLIDAGADVVIETRPSALKIAIEQDLSDIVKLLIDRGANPNNVLVEKYHSPLEIYAKRGNIELVNLLIQKAIAIRKFDEYCNKALILAASNGHKEVVKMLLENGADVSFVSNSGDTALMAAAWTGHKEVVVMLLENGADVSIVSKWGHTALALAAENGHEGVVRILLAHGACVDAVNDISSTALMLAANSGHKEVVEALIENGADVNAVNKSGNTALIVAASEGHEEVVGLLLEKGADVSAANSERKTALMLAASKCHEEVVRILRKKEAENAQSARPVGRGAARLSGRHKKGQYSCEFCGYIFETKEGLLKHIHRIHL